MAEFNERRDNRLSTAEKAFLAEYIVDMDVRRAVLRSDFTGPDSARATLKKPTAARYVEALLRDKHEKAAARVSVERVVSELATIGFANLGDYFSPGYEGDPFIKLSDLTHDQTAALSEITVDDYVDGRGDNARSVRKIKFKLHDKVPALVHLMNYALLAKSSEDSVAEVPFTVDFKGAATARITAQRQVTTADAATVEDDSLRETVDVPEAAGGDI